MASAITTWDVRLEEMHGLPPGGFGGTFADWVAVLHPDDREACLATVSEEETNFFPMVRGELGRNALSDLGDAMAQAKKLAPRALTRARPTSPRPTWSLAPPRASLIASVTRSVASRKAA